MQTSDPNPIARLSALLPACLTARQVLLAVNTLPIRLFNGYYEGFPGLVVDKYADCVVVSEHNNPPLLTPGDEAALVSLVTSLLPETQTILLKQRASSDPERRKGRLLIGENLPNAIEENGVRYALDLRLNQDESFYLDTRELRRWLKANSHGRTILNCFAYTGSLGIAALAGGAARVVQTDRDERFLQLAERSAALNRFSNMEVMAGDYFRVIGALKKASALFDTVILDPPYFSTSTAGKIDTQNQWLSLVNKARPLVAHEGRLVLINNALFLSGEELMRHLETITASGYAEIETIIQVPQDITGYQQTIVDSPPVSPSPFNHPTKIIILRVRRKDGRAS